MEGYTDDLLTLAAPSCPSCHNGTSRWPRYCSPVHVYLLGSFLHSHPDQDYASYNAEGLTNGFRIGYMCRTTQLRSQDRNHPLSRTSPRVVQERVAAELASGHKLGSIDPSLLKCCLSFHWASFQSKAASNKFRLIVDLSCPSGRSVNDGIPMQGALLPKICICG